MSVFSCSLIPKGLSAPFVSIENGKRISRDKTNLCVILFMFYAGVAKW